MGQKMAPIGLNQGDMGKKKKEKKSLSCVATRVFSVYLQHAVMFSK
jgi:hypothetical protein